jgi:hypothetical protein
MTNRLTVFTALLVWVFALAYFGLALAHDKGHTSNLNLTIEHVYPSGGADVQGGSTTQVFTGMDNEEFDKGMAMSAAGDTCVFDYAEGWQGCVGSGWYGSQSALNGSLVTRIDNWAVRVNLQTDTDFDEQAVGVGGSWHF